eukprot:TRINITY_DN43964_c0_g1_i1.p1 TRINITY_DN43964_c0_g1~~TRINITY_DN43964_c0_g1_i1.p1  ORF type:complete len:1171 (-),score=263.00 TRINITY_DN43964_c0_g1_i1:577-4089(-)
MVSLAVVIIASVVSALLFCPAPAHARESFLLATFDIHPVEATDSALNGTANMVNVGHLSLTRVGLTAPLSVAVPLTGIFAGVVSDSLPLLMTPKDAVEYLELTVGIVDGNGEALSDMYIYAVLVVGPDAPTTYVLSTSIDEFASAVETITVTQPSFAAGLNASRTVAVAMNATWHIRAASLPTGTPVVVRLAAASAPRNGTSPDAWFGLANHASLGRMAVYAAPATCGGGASCRHGSTSPSAWSADDSFIVYREPWQCQVVTSAGGPHGWTQRHNCTCDCYTDPLADVSTYNACDEASKAHPYAGIVCPLKGTVSDGAGVAMYDACDTIDGDLVINFPSPMHAVFPRVRRVIGRLEIKYTSQGTTSLPMLEQVVGLRVAGSQTTRFDAPRLRDVCAGSIMFSGAAVSEVRLAMLGRRPIESLDVYATTTSIAVDLGSLMGGPEGIVATSPTPYVVRMQAVSSHRITGVVGLSALQRVLPAPGTDSSVILAQLMVPADALAPLRDVEIGGEEGEGQTIRLQISYNDFGAGGVLELNGIRDVLEVVVVGNTGLSALRMPRLCGASWGRLDVSSNGDLAEVDLGSVGGGPRILDCVTSVCLHLQGTVTTSLDHVRGVGRVQHILGPAAGDGSLLLKYVGADVFTTAIPNATYGTGMRSLHMDISNSALPAVVRFAGVTELRGLSVTSTSGVVSLAFPNLAGDEMGTTRIMNNDDLTDVDLGSVGGGPLRFHSTSYTILELAGKSPAVALSTISGLWRTTTIETSGRANAAVTLKNWRVMTFPAPLLAATYGNDSSAVQLKVAGVEITGGGEVVFSGVTGIEYLSVTYCSGVSAWRFPNLATAVMKQIDIASNLDAHTLDLGSVSGGPRAIVTPPSAYDQVAIRLSGHTNSHLTTILGLEEVTLISCDPAGGSNPCSVVFQNVGVLPVNLMWHLTTYGQSGTPVDLIMMGLRLTVPTEAAFPNVSVVSYMKVTTSDNLTALLLPNWNASEAEAVVAYANNDLHTVDFGSVGGGPAMLTGHVSDNYYVVRVAGASSQPIETFLGMSNLATIRSYASKNNLLHFENLGTGASAAVQSILGGVVLGTGGESVRLSLQSNAFVELRLANVTALSTLDVSSNMMLSLLKFPAMPAYGITGDVFVRNNPALPDGCATDLQPLTLGTLTQFGNLGGTSCPV